MKRVAAVLAILVLAAALWFYHSPDQQPTHTTATPVVATPVPTPQSAPQPQTITAKAAQTAKAPPSSQVATSTAAQRMPIFKVSHQPAEKVRLNDRVESLEGYRRLTKATAELLCVRGPAAYKVMPHCDGIQPKVDLGDILLAINTMCDEDQACQSFVSQIYLDMEGFISTPARTTEEELNIGIAVELALMRSAETVAESFCAEQNMTVRSVFVQEYMDFIKDCVPLHLAKHTSS